MKIGEIFPPPEGGKAGTNKSQKPFYTKFLTVPKQMQINIPTEFSTNTFR
tara:strand:+ start:1368 stop:1517 length:150 start_codon:yes stop_codon:yes gene_type:complete